MRQIETRTLGAEHARTHAFQRAQAQREAAAERRNPVQTARIRAAAAAPRSAANVGGQWGPERPLPVIAITAAVLPKGPKTGWVLMFAYPARPGRTDQPTDLARAYLWDPTSGESVPVDPPVDPATGKPTNIWCGGISFLSDGRILVTGGNVNDPLKDYHGINDVFTFDPETLQWKREQPMRQGRWYPTQTLMPDGRTLVLGGNTGPGDPDFAAGFDNRDLEIVSADGTKTVQDPMRLNPLGTQTLQAPSAVGLYPHMYWLPTGRAFVAGPNRRDSWYLAPGTGGRPSAWADPGDLSTGRNWGTSFLDGSRVWVMGGSDDANLEGDGIQPAQKSTEIFDDTLRKFGPGPDMAVARSHANSVILPNGVVATIGGGFGNKGDRELYRWIFSDEQKAAELLNPRTGEVTLGNPQAEGRTYHSTAVLLPDGSIMSAGDDANGPAAAADDPQTTFDERRGEGTGFAADTAEIYRPPYLFNADGSPADRPKIEQAPPRVRNGDMLTVRSSGVPATSAVLIAPGATTHANDMSQRRIELGAGVPRKDGGVDYRVPGVDRAIPGYYMLFLLTPQGTPSTAAFVRVLPPIEPKLAVAGRLPSLKTVRKNGTFKLTVGMSLPGSVTITPRLELSRKGSKKKAYRAIAPSRRVRFTRADRRTVLIRLSKAGRKLLAGRRSGVLVVRSKARLDSKQPLKLLVTRHRLR